MVLCWGFSVVSTTPSIVILRRALQPYHQSLLQEHVQFVSRGVLLEPHK